MKLDKLPDNWLFEQHSKQTIRGWISQLNYFHFIRAWGGHANDGDAFTVCFIYTDRQDLISKLDQLGIILNTIPDDFPRPVIGKSYPLAEFEKFKIEVKRFRDLVQPRNSLIFGYKTFIWISENTIDISVAGTIDGNRYEVTESDFKVCLALEIEFDNLGWKALVDKNIENNVCCISKMKYPELYS